MRFTKEVIEQIGHNVIQSISDPILSADGYKVTKSDFYEIADNIGNATGCTVYIDDINTMHHTIKDIVVCDNEDWKITKFSFVIKDDE